MLKETSKALIIFGVFMTILSGFFIFERVNPNRLAFAEDQVNLNISSINTSQTPEQITIKDLAIDLPVFPAKLEGNKWEATSNGVSYLTSSALPGEIGNSVFYGHNYQSLLANLTKAKPGQIIEVKMTDGEVKTFIIKHTIEVSPNQTGILGNSESAKITLYTCSGFLDSKRFVVIGE